MTITFRTSPNRRRGAATALATALVAASLAMAPAAGAIEHPDYTNQYFWDGNVRPALEAGTSHDLGDLIVTLKPGATTADRHPIASVRTAPDAQPLPAGVSWLTAAEFTYFDGGWAWAYPTYFSPDSPESRHRGLSGFPLAYQDTPDNHIAGSGELPTSDHSDWTQSGYFRFVLSIGTNPNGGIRPGDDGVYFYDAILHVDERTNALSVVGGPVQEKTKTTTTAAASGVTATSATLTATVAPAAATGTVQFTQNGADIPGAQATLSGGKASYGVSGLTPSTAYTFGARYLGDDKHETSTGAAAPITTEAGAGGGDSSDSGIGVQIPSETSTEPSGLKIAVKPNGVSLSGPATREKNYEWQATGALGDVTVNDDRRVLGAKWTLNGKASAFTAADKTQLAANNLGWTPSKIDGAGTPGAGVAPGTDGLSKPQVLASGLGAAEPNVTTKVTAGLTLKVPAGTPGGNYTSTLTLTLI